MVPTWHLRFSELEKDISDRLERFDAKDQTARLVGLLFAKAGNDIVDKQIIPHYDYFTQRSGDSIDFFWPGWVMQKEVGPNFSVIPFAEEHPVFYADKFIHMLKLVEDNSQWAYTGGVDLMLFTAFRDNNNTLHIDFSGVILLPIQDLIANKVYPSVEILFERIFYFARKFKGHDPILSLPIDNTRKSTIDILFNAVMSFLPGGIATNITELRHLGVKDISATRSNATTARVTHKAEVHGPFPLY